MAIHYYNVALLDAQISAIYAATPAKSGDRERLDAIADALSTLYEEISLGKRVTIEASKNPKDED